MKITILVDDAAGSPPLVSEHGLAQWLEVGGQRLLFDTGQGDALLPNAWSLGVPVETADAVLLSHGHYDHTGGLSALLAVREGLPVYAHREVAASRYSRRRTGACQIGMPSAARQALARQGAFRAVEGATQVAERVWLTGPIPRTTDWEVASAGFSFDPDGREPDPIADDQAVFVETGGGLVLILGCGHAGLVNTLRHVESRVGGARVRAVVGGLHMARASDRQIAQTVQALLERDIERVVPCHCTGAPMIAALTEAFGPRCTVGACGVSLEFDD